MRWKLSRTVLRGEGGGNAALLLDRAQGRGKQPFFFQMKDENVFAFAGLWDAWGKDGDAITSCAIITTAPNDLVGAVHDLICTNSVKLDS